MVLGIECKVSINFSHMDSGVSIVLKLYGDYFWTHCRITS